MRSAKIDKGYLGGLVVWHPNDSLRIWPRTQWEELLYVADLGSMISLRKRNKRKLYFQSRVFLSPLNDSLFSRLRKSIWKELISLEGVEFMDSLSQEC